MYILATKNFSSHHTTYIVESDIKNDAKVVSFKVKMKSESEATQSCLTLFDPMGGSLPSFSVHGIFQARVLEWVAIPSPEDLPDPGIRTGSPTL